jgi:two-component sensor histidine kinase
MLETVPFITLFPAILLAALLGGIWVGLLVTIVSFLAGWYFFLPPYNSWTVETPGTPAILILFFLTAAIQLFVIDALNRTVDRLGQERDRTRTLFRELQHRVANNMTFVASLLRLQERTIEDDPENARFKLAEAQKRIQTMARIHRRLYDPQAIDQPISEYLEGLTKDILAAAGASHISANLQIAPVKLDLERLVTLSLLVNELITNSVKHGFKDRMTGRITLKLTSEDDSRVVLVISDDGCGYDGNAPVGRSLGTLIIQSLATQLQAELKWSRDLGTTAQIRFPLSREEFRNRAAPEG